MRPGCIPQTLKHTAIPTPAYPAGLLTNPISHAHTFACTDALRAGCQPEAHECGH